MTFPLFEFIGPKCIDIDCDGTLISGYSFISKKGIFICHKCSKEFDKNTVEEYIKNLNLMNEVLE